MTHLLLPECNLPVAQLVNLLNKVRPLPVFRLPQAKEHQSPTSDFSPMPKFYANT